jgi:hypothetical protein
MVGSSEGLMDKDTMVGSTEMVSMDYLDAREQGDDVINMGASIGRIQSPTTSQGGQDMGNQGQRLCWSESRKIEEDDDSDQERKWEAFMKGGIQEENLGGRLLQAMELMEEDLPDGARKRGS